MIQEAPAQYSWRGLSLPEQILQDAVAKQQKLSNSMFSPTQLKVAKTYRNKARRRVTKARTITEGSKQVVGEATKLQNQTRETWDGRKIPINTN